MVKGTKKQDDLAKSLRISNKHSDRMSDTIFYRYTIGKQNEQLTIAQYERYVRLFRDSSFKRPSKPLSKYPSAYDIMRKPKRKPKIKPSPSKKNKWIGNMRKHSATSLKRITKTGTKKQKALARKILNKRRKK